MNDPIVVTRELVKRGWSDFEPKLVAAIAGGGGTVVLTEIAKAYGIAVPQSVLQYTPLLVAAIIGWAAPSVGTTVTRKMANDTVQEQHSGNVVTTATASTPIVPPAPLLPSVPIHQPTPGVFTKVIDPVEQDETGATEIIEGPTYSRGQSILDRLGSARDTH